MPLRKQRFEKRVPVEFLDLALSPHRETTGEGRKGYDPIGLIARDIVLMRALDTRFRGTTSVA
jgi:hypothetical protein